jgi:hypothetical protein
MKINLTERELITMHVYLLDIVHSISNEQDKMVIKSALNKIYDYTDFSVYDGMIEAIIKNKEYILKQ